MTCMLSYLFSFLLSNNLCLMLAFPFLTFLWLNTGPVTPEAEISFLLLKQAFQIAPTLGLPDHNNFVLYVDECNGYIVICWHCRTGSPHLSLHSGCRKKAVLAIHDIVRFSPLTLHVSHWLNYNSIFLGLLALTINWCNTLNPAMLLPLPHNGEHYHSCAGTFLWFVRLTRTWKSPNCLIEMTSSIMMVLHIVTPYLSRSHQLCRGRQHLHCLLFSAPSWCACPSSGTHCSHWIL